MTVTIGALVNQEIAAQSASYRTARCALKYPAPSTVPCNVNCTSLAHRVMQCSGTLHSAAAWFLSCQVVKYVKQVSQTHSGSREYDISTVSSKHSIQVCTAVVQS
jgi:hypothetical protein